MSARRELALGLAGAAALTLATELGWLGRYAPSGRTEVAAVVLYAASVWLAVRNSILTWPVGIAATALYAYLFYEWRLYADAGLQVVFIGFSLAGLWAWRGRTRAREPGAARHVPARIAGLVVLAVVAGTVAVREYLLVVGGSAPFVDAVLTTGSLAALYLLIRRYFETWLLWVVLDVAYVALFVSRELYLSAGLYALLLVMAVKAASDWRRLLPAPAPASARA